MNRVRSPAISQFNVSFQIGILLRTISILYWPFSIKIATTIMCNGFNGDFDCLWIGQIAVSNRMSVETRKYCKLTMAPISNCWKAITSFRTRIYIFSSFQNALVHRGHGLRKRIFLSMNWIWFNHCCERKIVRFFFYKCNHPRPDKTSEI